MLGLGNAVRVVCFWLQIVLLRIKCTFLVITWGFAMSILIATPNLWTLMSIIINPSKELIYCEKIYDWTHSEQWTTDADGSSWKTYGLWDMWGRKVKLEFSLMEFSFVFFLNPEVTFPFFTYSQSIINIILFLKGTSNFFTDENSKSTT